MVSSCTDWNGVDCAVPATMGDASMKLRKSLCLSLASLTFAATTLAQSMISPAEEGTGERENAEYEDVQLIQEASIPTAPSLFVGVTPCRVVDTRGNGFGGQYGPPELMEGAPRDIVLVGRCGIPSNARAVSTNITAVFPSGRGNIKVFPKGTDFVPIVSNVNFHAGENTANAALVPLGDDGAITVVASFNDTNMVLDVNGYFVATPTTQKLCTAVNTFGFWRETIPAPESWTASQCQLFQQTTTPTSSHFQLGCLSEAGVSFGAPNGGIPSPNCGW